MKKNFINHICGAAMLLSLGLVACSDDKDLGTIGSEKIIISSVDIDKTDFEIKGDSICLVCGQSIEFKYKVNPENASNQELIWSSSDEEVVTVSQTGVITAGQKEGKAVIYVAPIVGFGPLAATPSRKIKVIKKATLIETLSLKSDNPEDIETGNTVLAGDVRQLLVTATPENHTYEKYTWTSSDPTVATVSETGLVETIKAGKVTITLVSRDGGNATASYSFTVNPSIIPTAVEFINTEKLQNLAYGETIDLQEFVRLTPEDATFALIKWSSDNDNLISVNSRGVLKIGFSITPSVIKMVGHSMKLMASNPEGKVLNSTSLTTAGGHFIHNFRDGLSPFMFDAKPSMSYTEHETYMHVELGVQSATDFRQDLKVANTGNAGGFMLSTTNYKYLAMKFRRPFYYNEATGEYSRYVPGKSGNKFAFNLTPTTGSNVGHWESFKQLDTNSCTLVNEIWDGQAKVYVWTLDAHNNLVSATDAATGLVDIKNADIVVADVKAEHEKSYDIYWIGTFSSLEEIKAYYEANE